MTGGWGKAGVRLTPREQEQRRRAAAAKRAAAARSREAERDIPAVPCRRVGPAPPVLRFDLAAVRAVVGDFDPKESW